MNKEKKEILNKTFEAFLNFNELYRGMGFLLIILLILYLLGVENRSNLWSVLSFALLLMASKFYHWILLANYRIEVTDVAILIKKRNSIKKDIKFKEIVRATNEDFKHCSFFTITYGNKTPYKMTKFCILSPEKSEVLKTEIKAVLLDFTGKSMLQIMIDSCKSSKR